MLRGLWPEQSGDLLHTLVSGASVSSLLPGDLRVQLADALHTSSPASASLVEDQRTNLTKVPADGLPGWQIIDVQNSAPPHPRRPTSPSRLTVVPRY